MKVLDFLRHRRTDIKTTGSLCIMLEKQVKKTLHVCTWLKKFKLAHPPELLRLTFAI